MEKIYAAIYHEMTKTKLTKQRKNHKKKNISGRGVRPHHLEAFFYSHFGRIGGQFKLATRQTFD
jgi:hypothetical protein